MLKESGYTVKDACNALGISRSSYYSCKGTRDTEVAASRCRDNNLLGKIKEIKAEHPFWGVRRLTAWLKHRGGLKVNRERVQKLMKKHGLLATQTVHRGVSPGLKAETVLGDRHDEIYGVFYWVGIPCNSIRLVYKEDRRLESLIKEQVRRMEGSIGDGHREGISQWYKGARTETYK